MTHDASPAMTHRTARRVVACSAHGPDARPAGAETLLARALAAALFLVLVALASLAPARAVSATFGWVPLWLLLLPASASLALQLRRWYAAQAGRDAEGGVKRRLGAARPVRTLQGTAGTPRAAMATQRRPRAARGAQVPNGSALALAVSRRGSTHPGRTKWQV